MTLALLDTTPLSNFAHVHRPELIRAALGDQAATTPHILLEFQRGVDLGLVPITDWTWLKIAKPTARERSLADEFLRQLDPGEAECLAVAVTRGGVFLSDDFAARRLAQLEGLPTSGTLGILLKLVSDAALTLDEADLLLMNMIRHGYRSPISTLRQLSSGSGLEGTPDM